jgi:hypothetical protein
MNKLIFNEKTYIENILKTHDKDILDINLFQLTQLITVYLYQEYDISDKEQLEKRVNAELELFNFDGYYYEAYYRTIRRIIQSVLKYNVKLKEVYKVPIYKNEYDIIKSCGDKKHQKLLITIYAMARWNGNEYGWTSSKCKLQHIKKSANLNMSNNDFYLLIHDLIVNGYINNTKKVGKFCFQPLGYNTDKNEIVEFEIDSFDDIGNKFIASQSNIHTTCCMCGRLIKKASPRTKYCPKCAKEVIKQKNNEVQKKRREKSRN